MKVRIRPACALAGVLLLVVTAGAAGAQTVPWQIVQPSDGSLWLVHDGVRQHLVPFQIPNDDALFALPEGQPLSDGVLLPSLVLSDGPTASPTAAPVAPVAGPTSAPSQTSLPRSALTDQAVRQLVTMVGAPAGTELPGEVRVSIDDASGAPMDLRFLFIDLNVPESRDSNWSKTAPGEKEAYVKAILMQVAASSEKPRIIYVNVWRNWTTDFIPQSIPLKYVDVSRGHFVSHWPDTTGRFENGVLEYQHADGGWREHVTW